MRSTGPGPVATAAVGIGFVALFMLLAGGVTKAAIALVTAHVETGKRYRWFFKTSRPVDRAQLDAAIGTLTLMGANAIDTSTGPSETRISYELTSAVTKDVLLDTPMMEFGDVKLIPVKIQEMT
jgi:4-hydroxybenzoate polyprenyltransferase